MFKDAVDELLQQTLGMNDVVVQCEWPHPESWLLTLFILRDVRDVKHLLYLASTGFVSKFGKHVFFFKSLSFGLSAISIK